MEGSIEGDFCFAGCGANKQQSLQVSSPSPVTDHTFPIASVDPKVLELRYWESSEKSNTQAAYNSYLRKYPTGEFTDLARDRVKELETAASRRAADVSEREKLEREKAELKRRAKEAEDGIRDLVRSRGLGDVYKRQLFTF